MKIRLMVLSFITGLLFILSGCSSIDSIVSFETNGGSEISPILVSQIDETTNITPTKKGYVFNNWTFENNDIATLETLKNLTTSTKIYANWNLVSYQLNYLNLMGSTHQNPIEYTIEDENIILKAPSAIIGYTFKGWSKEVPSTNYVTLIDTKDLGSIDLYANYELKNYNITYVDSFNQPHTNPTYFNIESLPITLAAPDDLEDYLFIGWSLSNDESLFIEVINEYFDEKITLYAVWESLIDITPPEISGLNPIEYTIGSTYPELLSGVYGTDNLDGEVLVSVDDSKVDYETVGTYTIYYSASDKAGNITNKTRTISVINALSSYYQSVTGLSGNSLKLQLRTIINTGFSGVNYGEARYALAVTDKDPNNPNNLIDFYTGNSLKAAWDEGKTWNREHVWPQSLLGVDAKNGVVNAASDLHNLTPSNPSTNSSRGNKYFDLSLTKATYFPERAAVRGDIARILLYMEVMYSRYTLVDTTPKINEMGKLSTLLKWHLEDPVDDFERNRNEVIFSYQGNRNPYIDYPEFVEMIYGVIVVDNVSSQIYFFEVHYVEPDFYKKSKYLN